MEPGYTLFDVVPEGSNAEFGALIVIVDAKGEVVWYQTGSRYTDVRQNDAGHLQFLEGGKYIEMDMLGNRLREWKAVGQSRQNISAFPVATPAFHHEVYPMDNGHFLALSIEERTYDNYPTSETDPAAPKAKARVAGDVIVEFGSDGKIVNQWSLLDILDPYRIGYGSLGKYWDSFFNTKTRDWSHGNAVIYDATDDAVIVSSRHLDTITKFSRQTGQLIWILAPPENWDRDKYGKYLLKPVNNTKYFFPYHAHAPMLLPNGHLMVYDNGNYRASPFDPGMPISDSFSRAVEYAIDEQNRRIKLVWQYGQSAPHRYFSAALGDADLLPNKNNVLITHGNVHSAEDKLAARIIEVTHSDPAREVFHIFITDETADPEAGWRVYRSDRIASLYPQSK
jgi:arylsulfate sulfotransferase